MKTQVTGQTLLVSTTAAASVFPQELSQKVANFADYHLILDLTGTPAKEDVLAFHQLAKSFRKNKKSFVVVAGGVDYDSFPQTLAVVPTIQEAHDVIEMEEIERDLGF
ncbi:MAG TPA: ribonuclease Z [Flavobacterium sp.]|nr:ribonuclease Z [Flavobacterium sp.]